MYLAMVLGLMVVLPILSVVVESLSGADASLILLIGKWFVFWGAGVRLLLAGLRQLLQPAFTAREIFHIEGDEALVLVRELGMANVALGVVGVLSLWFPAFVLPVAIAAAIFYGLAGVQHITAKARSGNETIAMVSDLFIFAVLLVYAGVVLIG